MGIFLVIGILFLVINLFINSANIFNIVSYCIKSNSLDKYWELFIKHCTSGRAIISSAIGFVLAVIIFFIVAPIVLIRRYIFQKKVNTILENGLFFEYDQEAPKTKFTEFNTNIKDVLGIDLEAIPPTGLIRIDAILVLGQIEKFFKSQNKEVKYDVMQKIALKDGNDATVPIKLTVDGTTYPTYFIYNETHQDQFQKVKNLLYDEGFKKCIYISTLTS